MRYWLAADDTVKGGRGAPNTKSQYLDMMRVFVLAEMVWWTNGLFILQNDKLSPTPPVLENKEPSPEGTEVALNQVVLISDMMCAPSTIEYYPVRPHLRRWVPMRQ